MSVDYENMTMEEYFTHKAASVEDVSVYFFPLDLRLL